MRVAVAPAELDGQKVEPGNAIIMLLVSSLVFQHMPNDLYCTI